MISRSVSSICSFLVLATVLGANLSQSVQSTEEIAQVTSPPRPAPLTIQSPPPTGVIGIRNHTHWRARRRRHPLACARAGVGHPHVQQPALPQERAYARARTSTRTRARTRGGACPPAA